MLKYLELDSTYRNRNDWPLPGEFQILLSASFSSNATTAFDPVSLATPLKAWQSYNFKSNTYNSSSTTVTTIATGIGASADNKIVTFTAPNLQQFENYYSKCVVSSPGIKSRILSYVYLGNDIGQITVLDPIYVPPGTSLTITDPTDTSIQKLFVPAGSSSENGYAKMYIYNETTTNFSKIQNYSATTGILSYEPITGWSNTDSFSIRKSIPGLIGTCAAASISSAVCLGPNSETSLVGSFIRILPAYPSAAPSGECKRIVAYNPLTFVATVYPAFSSNPAYLPYEILPYTRDNSTPFTYTGTSQNEFNTCLVKLVSLTLPKGTLAVGNGGSVTNYPYVYVQLTPLNTNNINITSSNNPNAISTLFRATKSHTHSLSKYVQYNGDGVVQKIKFKMENDFFFKVTLPSGETFETVEKEFYSPSTPNSEIQISALFEISK